MNSGEHRSRELESVLGATPHEFESRILRLIEGPDRSAVGAFVVPHELPRPGRHRTSGT
ncbi:hypothetical protein KCH_37100 [Kitasatospora cheerisanensis KCTC 2395]|uniref:Uncharacterized protein n=1 Tax=Kitasatospora cheerisanensis KCTC 2395 TaxID=1348663 RepID=A0A066YSU3_9ACTN|nr:hypothetical protein KCH_37100 [Kitasatospora cheerisanensis KCTC 2395]